MLTRKGRQPNIPHVYTKYRITKPLSQSTDYDDLYLAEPSRWVSQPHGTILVSQ